MLSNSSSKLIRSLQLKKYRLKYHLFVAEGQKTVATLLRSDKYEADTVWCTEKCLEEVKSYHSDVRLVEESTLSLVSSLKSRKDVLATFKWKVEREVPESTVSMIYLDDVQDPGNVGTIIRLADWYGVTAVVRSEGSADFYAPKTVQSSMGSIAGVTLVTMSHEQLLGIEDMTILCSDIAGTITPPQITGKTCLVIGNEGKGISQLLLSRADQIIAIKGSESKVAESLNASIAASILCDRIFGQMTR